MNFYVTFGQKYRHENHPTGGHPDGWFRIIAEDAATAHDIAFQLIGEKWAMLYDEKPSIALFPRGELKVLP